MSNDNKFAPGVLLALLLLISGHGWASEVAEGKQETIYVTAAILDVDAINSAEQNFTINMFVKFRWTDPKLAHDGDDHIRRNLADIEAPRVLLLNRQKSWSSMLDVVDVSPEGDVEYSGHLWGDFSQPLDLQKFPFDSHTLEIPIIALSSSGKPTLLLPDPAEESFMADRLSVADWRIQELQGKSRDIKLSRKNDAHGFVLTFRAERIYFHYLIKFIIPLILISAMSWVVFWIDPTETGSQLSVAVTAVLTLIAYHIALTGKLPDIPYLTRMDLFLFGSTLLVFSALIEVVFTSRLAKTGRLEIARKIDLACRPLFPVFYVLIATISLRW
jgi:hypothetical protein